MEYLESTGTQYIDTRIVCDDVSNYDMQISFVLQRVIVGNSGQDILGARKDTGNRSFILFVPNNMQGLFLNLAGYSSLNTPLVLSENIIKTGDLFNITAEINQLNNTATVVFNDVLLYENVSWVGDLYCGYSLYLFAVHGDSGIRDPVAAKIYKYRMFKNDVLVLDFIPVLDSYGVPCMYDRVTDSFFYNQGTGQFIPGPVKQ